jgi:hypothetical protein
MSDASDAFKAAIQDADESMAAVVTDVQAKLASAETSDEQDEIFVLAEARITGCREDADREVQRIFAGDQGLQDEATAALSQIGDLADTYHNTITKAVADAKGD